MPRNGADVYSKLAGSVAVPSATIESGDYNLQLDDIVAALNDVAMLSGSKPLTGLQTTSGVGTAALHQATVSQVQNSIVAHATVVGGTVDAIELTFAPAFTANTAKTFVRWTSAGVNTITNPTVKLYSAGAALTIKKGASAALAAGDTGASGYICYGVYDGTDFILLNPATTGVSSATTSAEGIVELLTTTESLTGTDTTRAMTADALAAHWEAGADITDGATITIGEGGYFNLITSTTAITAFTVTTDKAGRTFRVRFNTARTLTHNATSLILPGGANITTAQGDIAQFRSLGSGNVVCEWYTKADGTPIVTSGITVASEQATTSGSSKDFTGIPSTAKRIVIMFDSVSINGGDTLLVQIGDSGGLETTGYASGVADIDGTETLATSTSGFAVGSLVAASVASGSVTLNLQDASNTWVASGTLYDSNGPHIYSSAGMKALSATLDRVSIVVGATFDAGSVSISYQ